MLVSTGDKSDDAKCVTHYSGAATGGLQGGAVGPNGPQTLSLILCNNILSYYSGSETVRAGFAPRSCQKAPSDK